MQKIHQLHRGEEEKWRLKSQSVWLKTEDKNTKFFHKQTKSREIRNTIKEISSAKGQILKSFKEIEQEVHSHYQSHFTEEGIIN